MRETIGKPNQDRQINDFYATHPNCLKALLKYEKFNNAIWEPACGMGHLSEGRVKGDEKMTNRKRMFNSEIVILFSSSFSFFVKKLITFSCFSSFPFISVSLKTSSNDCL